MAKKQEGRPVVVTTKHRGVFFGYATDTSGETINLSRARLCLRWDISCKGFMGLAKFGPVGETSRVGPAVDIELRDITAVLECTPAAVKQWEKAPW